MLPFIEKNPQEYLLQCCITLIAAASLLIKTNNNLTTNVYKLTINVNILYEVIKLEIINDILKLIYGRIIQLNAQKLNENLYLSLIIDKLNIDLWVRIMYPLLFPLEIIVDNNRLNYQLFLNNELSSLLLKRESTIISSGNMFLLDNGLSLILYK